MNPFVDTSKKLKREAKIVAGRAGMQADVSNPNTVQAAIRSRRMDATMKLIRGLYPISDVRTYQNVVRYLLIVANSTLIRCMCVGISPYENGILPPVASNLAYSPM